jgi:4-aminobutyrate aminotransferase/(S)-3-amino-2-methylpropionate transaminase
VGYRRQALERAARRNDIAPIAYIRGPGAMLAFDIVGADGSPDAAATKKVIQAALADGLILLSCGIHGNSIRLLNPLTISDALLDEGLEKLEHALIAARN